jgi:hypothetical protein
VACRLTTPGGHANAPIYLTDSLRLHQWIDDELFGAKGVAPSDQQLLVQIERTPADTELRQIGEISR